jgi:hypothetical protein
MNRVFAPDESLFERQWALSFHWPEDFRKLMFWIFAATSLGFSALLLYSIPRHPPKVSLLQNLLIGRIFCVHVAAVSGLAAWTIWKAHTWARGWAIAASLMYLVIFMRRFVIPIRPAWDHGLLALSVGLVGLAAFAWQVGDGFWCRHL